MTTLEKRLQSWQQYDEARELEKQNRAFLSQKPAPNPEHLTRLVRIKRIGRGFIANGQPVELGEIVKVSAACARELVYLGKAEYVE